MNARLIPLDEQKALRRQLRTARCALSETVSTQAARAICDRVTATDEFLNARTVAAYLAVNGELDVGPLIEQAWARDKTVYVPVVRSGRGTALEFRTYAAGAPVTLNRYGIPEPEPTAAATDARSLDLVLCPLVAFDLHGTRIGMGGGYYDASFAFRLENPAPPILLGVAYASQQVGRLERNDWDVPVDGVVTENDLLWFHGKE